MTHAVVWIDHKEARIFHVHQGAADESTVLSPPHHIHRHPKGHGEPREHPDDAKHFFEHVAPELDGVDSVLILGPASAKHEFVKFVHENHRHLVSRIVGVETADHPTGGEIVAHARSYFKASDRMGQSSRRALIFAFRVRPYGQGDRRVSAPGLRHGSHTLSLAGTGPRS